MMDWIFFRCMGVDLGINKGRGRFLTYDMRLLQGCRKEVSKTALCEGSKEEPAGGDSLNTETRISQRSMIFLLYLRILCCTFLR
jgi:hypothetical protein